jgi:hypothetical protein
MLRNRKARRIEVQRRSSPRNSSLSAFFLPSTPTDPDVAQPMRRQQGYLSSDGSRRQSRMALHVIEPTQYLCHGVLEPLYVHPVFLRRCTIYYRYCILSTRIRADLHSRACVPVAALVNPVNRQPILPSPPLLIFPGANPEVAWMFRISCHIASHLRFETPPPHQNFNVYQAKRHIAILSAPGLCLGS